MPSTYEPLSTTTLSSSQASITFNPSTTYTDLIIVANYLVTSAGYGLTYRFNSDGGSTYSYSYITGSGSTVSSAGAAATFNAGTAAVGALTSTEYTVTYIHIFNYYNSNVRKASLVRSGANTGSYPGTEIIVNLWSSLSQITSIELKAGNGAANFASGSSFTLYGIKAA